MIGVAVAVGVGDFDDHGGLAGPSAKKQAKLPRPVAWTNVSEPETLAPLTPHAVADGVGVRAGVGDVEGVGVGGAFVGRRGTAQHDARLDVGDGDRDGVGVDALSESLTVDADGRGWPGRRGTSSRSCRSRWRC